jgi:TonB family protein
MMDGHLFSNLVSYSAQIACVAGVGGVTLSLLHVDVATLRHALWRGLLVLCVMLPWVQGRAASPRNPGLVSVVATTAPTGVSHVAADGLSADGSGWLPLIAIVLGGGAAARVLWIAAGLVRLRRMRTAGEVATPIEDWVALQRRLGAWAEIRFVPGLEQPVTFGLYRPIVLLPDGLRHRRPEIQQAVVCHELIHVRRHDWLWVLSEETVRAALWFHPAVWWVISRVQLTREEVVDELTVLSTASRRAYIEALLVFADHEPPAPVAAFGRRHHLFRRVVLLTKEGGMSARRALLSGGVAVLVVVTGCWYAVDAFPLIQDPQVRSFSRTGFRGSHLALAQVAATAEPGSLESRVKPITPENPVPRRRYGVLPLFPADAPADVSDALVTFRVTLDATGRVAELRPLGPTTLSTGGTRVGAAVQGTVDLRRRDAAGQSSTPGNAGVKMAAFYRAANDAIRQWLYEAPADPPIAFDVTIRFRPDAEAQLISHGTPFRAAIGGTTGRGLIPPPPPPPPPPSPVEAAAILDTPAWANDGMHVGVAPTRVRQVSPIYPAVATAAAVQGIVVLEVRIGPDGRVTNARALRSIPLLDQAALDAVLQWEYEPTLLNGRPVPVLIAVTVNFTLQ